MSAKFNVHTSSTDAVIAAIKQASNVLWFGAVSFEERALGSMRALLSMGCKLDAAVVVDYPTIARPIAEDQRRRTRYRGEMSSMDGVLFKEIEFIRPDAYTFGEILRVFQNIVREKSPTCIIYDITCLTKIHSLALGAMISAGDRDCEWVAAYSIPESYCNLAHLPNGSWWRDIIVAPLAGSASLSNESHSRGIVIPGHESDRLVVGLAELEPAGGVIIMADTFNRPDLHSLSKNKNRKVIRQLTAMRSSDWQTQIVRLDDISGLWSTIGSEIAIAASNGSPVILFPYGPKPMVFFSALQLLEQYSEGSWFVYPIPSSYDVNYSEGVERTLWFWCTGYSALGEC